jgi:hypothetical protein
MKTLTKEFQFGTFDVEGGVWSAAANASNWRMLTPTNAVASTYFDLAGMSQREKTMFFEAAAVQTMFNPFHTGGQAGDAIGVYDVMTSEPMNDAELIQFLGFGNFAEGQTNLGFQETIYAKLCEYVVDLDTAQWGKFVKVSENQIGSLEATASDRVYCYRLMTIGQPIAATRIVLYPVRYILRAEPKEEAEYQYLMRLRRSYELQQSYDED